MKKITVIAVGLVMIALALFCSGCESTKGKSYNIAGSGLGGEITTAVDPSTGAAMPSVKFGSIDTSLLSHLPGDGSQVKFTTQKSFWSSEIGSQVCQVNCRGGIKSLVIMSMPQGPTVVSLEEYDLPNTAKTFYDNMKSIIDHNSDEVNVKVKTMLDEIRKTDSVDPATKKRHDELAKISDAELYSLKASDNAVDNRMIGNEILWRVVNKATENKALTTSEK